MGRYSRFTTVDKIHTHSGGGINANAGPSTTEPSVHLWTLVVLRPIAIISAAKDQKRCLGSEAESVDIHKYLRAGSFPTARRHPSRIVKHTLAAVIPLLFSLAISSPLLNVL